MRCVIIILFFFSLAAQAQRNYKVAGYISGDSLIHSEQIAAGKVTHLHYTFAGIQNGQVVPGVNDSINLLRLAQLKEEHPHLKVLVSIGGKNGSEGFSKAVSSDSSREQLAVSALAYLKKYRLDGIEIHWVFKPRGMFGNAFNRVDQHNLVLLLKTLRAKLDAQSTRDQRKKKNRYLLCLAGSSKRQYLFHSQLNTAHAYLDYINLQTFEYKVEILNAAGVSNAKVSSHHSSLYPSRQDSWMRLCVDRTVREYLNHNIPSRKLVVGVAFYGMGWTNAYEDFNGVYQWVEGPVQDDLSFKNIQATYRLDDTTVEFWDKQAKASYLYNKNNGLFISYDNKRSVRKKVRYIRRHKLGGAVFSDYRQDDDGALLRPLRRGLRRITFPYLIF